MSFTHYHDMALRKFKSIQHTKRVNLKQRQINIALYGRGSKDILNNNFEEEKEIFSLYTIMEI